MNNNQFNFSNFSTNPSMSEQFSGILGSIFNGQNPSTNEMLNEQISPSRSDMEKRMRDMMNEIRNPNNMPPREELSSLRRPNPPRMPMSNDLSSIRVVPITNTQHISDNVSTINETNNTIDPEPVFTNLTAEDDEIPSEILEEMHRDDIEEKQSEEDRRRLRLANLIDEAKIKARDNALEYKNGLIKEIIDPICEHFEKHLVEQKDNIFNQLVNNYQAQVYDVENDSWRDLRSDVRIPVTVFTSHEFPKYGSYYLNLLISEISKRYRLKVMVTEDYDIDGTWIYSIYLLDRH